MDEAFREEGLRVGFYHSLLDWHHPEYPVDRCHPQREDQAFRAKTKKRDVRKYAEYLRAQVEELLTRFGKIDILWFDFSFPGKDGKGREDWQSHRALERLEGMGRWMRRHSRSIYGCGQSEFTPPVDCRYTQNGKRLYLHVFNWPFRIIYCPGLAGKVEYAQLLHDGSEVFMKGLEDWQAMSAAGGPPPGTLALTLPVVQPDAEVPVVEMFLK
jgi:hypothetical protein